MIYNPFKPHVYKDKHGRFYIRRLDLEGWRYLSSFINVWLYFAYESDSYSSLEQARVSYNFYRQAKVNEQKPKVYKLK
jgi:hypothetical protein